ncbi:hypothetical protein [Rhizobium leguminosarum]|uniref:hypothetical protein n=1 Tax=Rhizobium leguminosarum TaxID=384 RepID=UPI003F959D2F
MPIGRRLPIFCTALNLAVRFFTILEADVSETTDEEDKHTQKHSAEQTVNRRTACDR